LRLRGEEKELAVVEAVAPELDDVSRCFRGEEERVLTVVAHS